MKYHAVVNLGGFVRVIDTLGGINVNVVRAMCDPPTTVTATAGASRSRPAAIISTGPRPSPMRGSASPSGESDFTRAARQQEVLTGIRDS